MKAHRSECLVCHGLKKRAVEAVLGLDAFQKGLLSELQGLVGLPELRVLLSGLLVGRDELLVDLGCVGDFLTHNLHLLLHKLGFRCVMD